MGCRDRQGLVLKGKFANILNRIPTNRVYKGYRDLQDSEFRVHRLNPAGALKDCMLRLASSADALSHSRNSSYPP